MEISTECKEIFSAIAKAQGIVEAAELDRTNTFFNNSKYASLASVNKSYRKQFAENGLGVVQSVSNEGEEYYLHTVLTHSSGQWIKEKIKLILDKKTMQGLGSAITYGRRYEVSGFAGNAADEDDDGNAASGAGSKKQQSNNSKQQNEQDPPPSGGKEKQSKQSPPATNTPPVVKKSGDFVLTFGENKDKKISELAPEVLKKAMDWAEGKLVGMKPEDKNWAAINKFHINAIEYCIEKSEADKAAAQSQGVKPPDAPVVPPPVIDRTAELMKGDKVLVQNQANPELNGVVVVGEVHPEPEPTPFPDDDEVPTFADDETKEIPLEKAPDPLGEYKIEFGLNLGKTLAQLGNEKVKLLMAATSKSQSMTGAQLNFMEAGKKFLDSRGA